MSEPLFRASLPPPEGERPLLLAAVCVVGALAAVTSLVAGVTGSAAQAVGPLFWPALLVSAGGTLLAVWGLWRLRRWGVGVYAATALVDNAVLHLMGEWRWFSLAIPLLVLAVCAHAWRRLR
jgi:hypothetical protein